MRGKILSGLIAGALGAVLSFNPAVAAEDHKAEAIKHAEAAVASGKQGDAKGVGDHAAMAKTHVDMAKQEKANEHLDMANQSLDSAIEHSKMGHADIAGNAAAEAVTHLKAAQ
jgi:hypothetical protein